MTFESCGHIDGPFFHGTRSIFYVTALREPAIWAAEPALALAGSDGRGRVSMVEPTGPVEEDPNVTNKKFPGNVTRSHRTRHPMRIVEEVHNWFGHAPEVMQDMPDTIMRLRAEGLDVIED